MSNKLQNIKAIKQMLDGSHRFQTRKSYYVGSADKEREAAKIRNVGDRWIEESADGTKTYIEQRSGYKFKSSTPFEYWESRSQLLEELRSFPNCQRDECTCKSPSRSDEKFRKIMGMCTDCVAEVETRMQIRGEFPEYAKKKIRANVESYIRDIEIEFEHWKNDIRGKFNYANGDATIEEWQSTNPEVLIEQMEKELQEMKIALLAPFNSEDSNEEG